MMILKLKERYGEHCVVNEIPEYATDYVWFKNDEHDFIGINKSKLSLGEKELLATLLIEMEDSHALLRNKLLWQEYLVNGKTEYFNKLVTYEKTISFVFFTHHFDAEMKTEFTYLMKSCHESIVVLFLTSSYGVILDMSQQSNINFNDIAIALQQDFYQTVSFYQTNVYPLTEGINTVFQKEFELYQLYRKPSALTITEHDLVTQFLTFEMYHYEGLTQTRQVIATLDADLIEVAKCYIEHNLNSSMAAKVIYMHRNTFMNKLERFILETGLNIKEFKYASIAYFLILGRDIK